MFLMFAALKQSSKNLTAFPFLFYIDLTLGHTSFHMQSNLTRKKKFLFLFCWFKRFLLRLTDVCVLRR